MAVLHWAVSQSLFLSELILYANGKAVTGSPSLGYSSSGLVLSITLGGLIVTSCVGLGILRRYHPGLPLLGRSSLVMLEACKRRPQDHQVELKPVQWGVISTNEQGVIHCGFTNVHVRMPHDGELCV